jgi:hypothetical protein
MKLGKVVEPFVSDVKNEEKCKVRRRRKHGEQEGRAKEAACIRQKKPTGD